MAGNHVSEIMSKCLKLTPAEGKALLTTYQQEIEQKIDGLSDIQRRQLAALYDSAGMHDFAEKLFAPGLTTEQRAAIEFRKRKDAVKQYFEEYKLGNHQNVLRLLDLLRWAEYNGLVEEIMPELKVKDQMDKFIKACAIKIAKDLLVIVRLKHDELDIRKLFVYLKDGVLVNVSYAPVTAEDLNIGEEELKSLRRKLLIAPLVEVASLFRTFYQLKTFSVSGSESGYAGVTIHTERLIKNLLGKIHELGMEVTPELLKEIGIEWATTEKELKKNIVIIKSIYKTLERLELDMGNELNESLDTTLSDLDKNIDMFGLDKLLLSAEVVQRAKMIAAYRTARSVLSMARAGKATARHKENLKNLLASGLVDPDALKLTLQEKEEFAQS